MFRALLGLPPRLVRRLAGRPVVRRRTAARRGDAVAAPAPAADPRPGPPAGRVRDPQAARRSTRLAGGRQPIGETLDLEVPGGAGPVPARLYIADRPGRLGRARAAAGLPARRRHGLRRPRHARRDLPAARRAGRRQGPRGRLPAGSRAPVPRGGRGLRAAFAGRPSTPTSSVSTRTRVAVGGDSAGGTLAAVTAIKAAGAGLPLGSSCWSTRRRTWSTTARAGGCSARASSSPATSSSSRTPPT